MKCGQVELSRGAVNLQRKISVWDDNGRPVPVPAVVISYLYDYYFSAVNVSGVDFTGSVVTCYRYVSSSDMLSYVHTGRVWCVDNPVSADRIEVYTRPQIDQLTVHTVGLSCRELIVRSKVVNGSQVTLFTLKGRPVEAGRQVQARAGRLLTGSFIEVSLDRSTRQYAEVLYTFTHAPFGPAGNTYVFIRVAWLSPVDSCSRLHGFRIYKRLSKDCRDWDRGWSPVVPALAVTAPAHFVHACSISKAESRDRAVRQESIEHCSHPLVGASARSKTHNLLNDYFMLVDVTSPP